MSDIRVQCVDQHLIAENTPLIASGGVNEDRVIFEFDSLWDGYTKTAVFYRDQGTYAVLLGAGDTATIPQEVIASDGAFNFGVMGVNNGTTRTSEMIRYNVRTGAATQYIPAPTQDIYQQILQAISGVVTPEEVREQHYRGGLKFWVGTEAQYNALTPADGTLYIITDVNIADAERTSNKVTSISSSSTDTQYPSAKAVYTKFNAVDTAAEKTANKVTTVGRNSTDAKYPSAKAVALMFDPYADTASSLSSIDSGVRFWDENTTGRPVSDGHGICLTYCSCNTTGTTRVQLAVAEDSTNHKIKNLYYRTCTNNSSWSSWEDFTFTKEDLGLGNVENKSSETIRGEITAANITAALGSAIETTGNRVTSVGRNSVDTKYPTAKAVSMLFDPYADISSGLGNIDSGVTWWDGNTSGAPASNKSGICMTFCSHENTGNTRCQVAISTDIEIWMRKCVNNSDWTSWSHRGSITQNDVTTALGFTPESTGHKVTSVSSASTDTQYPSAKAVYTIVHNLDTAAEKTANKVTTVGRNSTDAKYPSALSVAKLFSMNTSTNLNKEEIGFCYYNGQTDGIPQAGTAGICVTLQNFGASSGTTRVQLAFPQAPTAAKPYFYRSCIDNITWSSWVYPS